MIQGVHDFNRSWGLSGGACFGVTDPSRLRPPSTPLTPMPPLSDGPSRRIVMVDDGQGNMVPDDQLPERK